MKISCHSCNKKVLATAVSAAIALAVPMMTSADTSNEELQSQIDALQRQVTALNSDVQQAAEWKNPNTLVHMAGYANVGFSKTDADGDDGSFNVGSFAPIFHFQYRDIVMLESELEFEVAEDGETEVKLEYLSIDWFINDNMVLVAGQFLSPIGQFRQNLHPSWINKLPSAAPGFGHDGAAPVSDMGVQLRGGFHLGGMKANYAVYTGNGPEVKAEIEELNATTIDAIEYDGIAAEAFGADRDGEKVVGGRFGILPMPSLEIGVSFLSGKATVTEYEGTEDVGVYTATPVNDLTDLSTVNASSYDVTGVDVSWRNKDMDVRYEYVMSELGATNIGGFDIEAASWTTWYTQLAYKVPATKLEAVIRYTDFDSPGDAKDLQQTALGVNYLFTSNFIGKVAFESNDNPNAGLSADNRWLLQLAYGF
jgi:outer membrane murein-binding lipoprotein Lpp